jgi:hypothetical protein
MLALPEMPARSLRSCLGRFATGVVTNNFNHPDRQWAVVASAERTRAFITRGSAVPAPAGVV